VPACISRKVRSRKRHGCSTQKLPCYFGQSVSTALAIDELEGPRLQGGSPLLQLKAGALKTRGLERSQGLFGLPLFQGPEQPREHGTFSRPRDTPGAPREHQKTKNAPSSRKVLVWAVRVVWMGGGGGGSLKK
jgi:hypothetical protein